MFGNMFRALKVGKVAAEVNELLMKNYNLQADHSLLTHFVKDWISLYDNPHALAVVYVANQIGFMERNNPKHLKAAGKYIRVAKQAYALGAANTEHPMENLRKNAAEKLGINIDTINASPY